MKFIPASELKKKYKVYGHFYSILFPCGNTINCRSILEIISKDIEPDMPDTLQSFKPDCIFIMMNPGSSSPNVEVNDTVQSAKIKNMKISYVPAKPDTTQYQVMRVMNSKGWDHVRVLNLSDLRNPRSGEFVKTFNEVETYQNGHIHSIFSELRSIELDQKMKRQQNAPVVCAWGVSDELNPLIERCIQRIDRKCRRTGVCKDNENKKYYHPLPSLQVDKEKWIKNILRVLN